MPVFALPPEHIFPDPRLARADGLLAIGGDLHPARVMLGYGLGIFAWYSEGQPILWHSPDPRFVLFVEEFRVARSLRKRVRQRPYEITMDTDFEGVVDGCARTPRPGQRGTWITAEMRACYLQLHRAGLAHSVEAREGGRLVGGVFGVSLGGMFFGESMFATRPDASKIGFVHLVEQLRRWGFDLIDSQVYTHHLARFGAREIPRSRYLELLHERVVRQDRRGPWRFEPDALDPGRMQVLAPRGPRGGGQPARRRETGS